MPRNIPQNKAAASGERQDLYLLIYLSFIFFLTLKSVCLTARITFSTFCRRVCGLMLCRETVEKRNMGKGETKLKLALNESSKLCGYSGLGISVRFALCSAWVCVCLFLFLQWYCFIDTCLWNNINDNYCDYI